MKNVFAALSRTARPSDLTTAAEFSLAADQPHSHTKKRARPSGGIISRLSTAFRPSSGRPPGGTRPRLFLFAVAATTLAGFAGKLLAVEVTGALLKERLSRNRGEQFSDAQQSVATESTHISIEDCPSSPTLPSAKFHLEPGDQVHSGQEEPDEVELNQDTPNKSHFEPSPLSKLKDNIGWVMINEVPSRADPPPALSSSTRSLDAVSLPSPLGVYHRDYAYPSSSSLGSSAVPQTQTQLYPPASNASFVTALTSFTSDGSPRSSLVGKVPPVVGNRCESPPPMHPFKRPVTARRPSSLRVSTGTDTGGELSNGIRRLLEEYGYQSFDLPSAVTEESSESTLVDHQDSTRRVLIIGSSYRRGARKTHTMYSITTLPGAENDISLLEEAFEGRGYVVEVINHHGFRRDEVLDRVGAFLRDAKPGHIRAIAFIGHACTELDGTIVLVPPHCPTPEMAIPQADWENVIRMNAAAGSVVFSIMAHCFSGGFMEQEQDCQTWKTQGLELHPHSAADKPAFITFASSTRSQPSFESTVKREDPEQSQDHFLYALAMTINATEVRTWEAFFVAFKHYFDRARSGASWAARFDLEKHLPEEGAPAPNCNPEHTSTWRTANRQDPSFSASEILGYSNMFVLPAVVS